MRDNPLLKLHEYGQDIWLDYIRRHMITSGQLKRFIEEDGLLGITSNPSIFDKAIAGSRDYDETIRALALEGKTEREIYESLALDDIRHAADLFRPVFEKLDGRDGFVSLEVNPHLAHDLHGTIEEARRLWAALDRPNTFVKVPATKEGLSAIRQLISEGINVNVTLLFGLNRYREVADAYLSGIEDRLAAGKPLKGIASVASFFLSRIDVLIDPMLKKIMEDGGSKAKTAESLLGQTAIASAKVASTIYEEIVSGKRFRKLEENGARPQRLLWASTSTKNPEYADVKYVEALIGPETVNTVPMETLNAYRDHGNPAPRLQDDLPKAADMLDRLSELGVDLDEATQKLEDQGIEKFNKPYDSLMQTLSVKKAEALREPADRQVLELGRYEAQFRERMEELRKKQFAERLWRKDASIWTTDSEQSEQIKNGLGWLHVAEKMAACPDELKTFTEEVFSAGFEHVVHMGMGGSSLAPLVFERTFSPGRPGLPLTVLDTTDPATIKAIESRIPLKKTLFIVASKSGTTAEPLAFGEYFYARVKEERGVDAGDNFIVITDPGTPLVKLARDRKYRKTFLNFSDIGGRYSALSYFGMVPVALMGLDVEEVLIRALRMLHACAPHAPLKENPGVSLGAALGELARLGRSKVTFFVPPRMASLGMWLEQLIAESTGKNGTGILPVAGEAAGTPSVYGQDRVFVRFRTGGKSKEMMDRVIEALERAGHPVITITLADEIDIGQEFFRWEIATATAGAVLGINPFDQPNVQESKSITNRMLSEYREKGAFPAESSSVTEKSLSFYDGDGSPNLVEGIAKFLRAAKAGDYFAILAYLPEGTEIEKELEGIRLMLRNELRIATTIGFGPRYLHSTGQLHKGGPDTGLFLQLTADPEEDLPVPGESFTFGILQQAQAMGDLAALRRHGRRAVRVHLGGSVAGGLAKLKEVFAVALGRIKL